MRKNGLLWKKPTTVGTYKGNLVVVRKVNKKSVDLNRSILKELNDVSLDLLSLFCHVNKVNTRGRSGSNGSGIGSTFCMTFGYRVGSGTTRSLEFGFRVASGS